ncbi:MAG: VanZ family protein [Casimicrobiaceae bacterium]
MEPPPAPRHTRLPHVLAVLYGIAIVYVSLEPFAPWLAPPPGTPFFLLEGWPARWTRYDAALNVVAYAPFGFFLALLRRGATPIARIVQGAVIGAVFSFAMESLQMYIPPRDASPFDLVMNSVGAVLGAMLAAWLAGHAPARRALYDLRARAFIPGHLGDIGLALLALWLVAQMNPGIPLFAATFDADPMPGYPLPAPVQDGASLLLQAAASAFHLLGVGLFVALLLRRRASAGIAVLLLIGIALLLKGAAGVWLLKPAAWQTWVKPGVLIGIATGALLLPAAIGLPRPVQVAACAIALLSSLLGPVLVPETLSARVPLALFDWHYGQLLNYSGLTRSALLAWPLLAAAWLFALAGRPGWGMPADAR